MAFPVRNTAWSGIDAQMINASTGAPFVGTVTCYLNGDDTGQVLGSVAAGVCSSVGNGVYVYAPTAAETNFAKIAFTFIGTGAINQTITIATITQTQLTANRGTATGTSTGQNVLDRMKVLAPELQTQAGGIDVATALTAINMAQSYMESVFALHPDILGDVTGTVTTTNNTESTAWPTGLLRLDRLQYLDAVTNKPSWDLLDIRRTGGHAATWPWPTNLVTSTGTGAPRAYWTNGTNIYWNPLPDATYSVRWYGFQVAAAVTAAGFLAYPDICMTPLANMAARLIRLGLDDNVSGYQALAEEVFQPVVTALSSFQRERAPGMNYTYRHDT